MVAYRSADRGKTWTGPKTAWKLPYNQHGFVPLVPRGSKRLYAFGTEPIFGHSATSEGWHVQWESVPPGQESEPRSLGCIRGGNEADEANRQSRPWDGERVTGPQRK